MQLKQLFWAPTIIHHLNSLSDEIYFKPFLVVLLSFAFSSCLNNESVEPTIIIEPPIIQLVGSDTIKTGSYMGFTIGEDAENTYTAVKFFKDSKGKGITYLNVVSNIFTDVSKLDERLSLYQSIFLDEAKGTESGVQIAFENDKVKSIFLNSGKQLGKGPLNSPLLRLLLQEKW